MVQALHKEELTPKHLFVDQCEKYNFVQMKLFAVACLTGATAQSGDYDDRGSVGASDYYNGYDNYDEFGNKKKKNQQNWFGYGAKQIESNPPTGGTDWASALNCWPANIEADQIVSPNFRLNGADNASSRNPNIYPNQKFTEFGPQHVLGSLETTYRASERQSAIRANGETGGHLEDPVLRSGLGGLYQYGHDTWNSEQHNQKKDTNSNRGTHWQHYKQARHAGCLYEKSDWHYGHKTFDKVFTAAYYQGYSNYDGGSPLDAFVTGNNGDDSGAGKVEPVWWHFFNSHVLPNGNSQATNTPRSDTKPNVTGDGGFFDVDAQRSIPLVMANPAYEGLGYLNFVVEYKYTDFGVGDDYREFIDSSPGGNAGTDFRSLNTYRAINDCDAGAGQECSGWGANNNAWDGVHGFYYYDLYMGSWAVTETESRTWTVYPFNDDNGGKSLGGALADNPWSLYDAEGGVDSWYNENHDGGSAVVDWSVNVDLAVSSFPHNNLGKDFRFNLRVLQGMKDTAGRAPQSAAFKNDNNTQFYSYYFYKINQIDIEFPFPVAYALYNENRKSPTTGNPNTGTRIDTIDIDADDWWQTFNQDANHPAYHDGKPENYALLNTGAKWTNINPHSETENPDYQFLHRSASDDNANIIPPVDLGSHAPNGGGFHRIRGFIDYAPTGGSDHFADWCANSGSQGRDVALEITCGRNFHIKGLMNTYDERRGQRGTYQEIWVQLSYAMGSHGRGTRNGASPDRSDSRVSDDTNEPFQSPWPYNHFMASEIVSIQAKCNTIDVNNANTCRDQPAGPGYPNDSFYGGK